jgi:hypothetical protein
MTAVILLAILAKPSPTTSIGVAFLGYTNLPNNHLRFALFRIANHDRVQLRWRGVSTEVEGDSNLKAPIMNPSLPWITPTPLKIGGSRTLGVGEPLDGERWRVQLCFSRCTLRERLFQYGMTHNLPSPFTRLIPDMPPILMTNTAWLTH